MSLSEWQESTRWDRYRKMKSMRHQGLTYERIGRCFNLSGERVKQLIVQGDHRYDPQPQPPRPWVNMTPLQTWMTWAVAGEIADQLTADVPTKNPRVLA